MLLLAAAAASWGWSGPTVRHVAWSAVDFFPPDLARQVRRHHRRYDAGIQRGLAAPPSWRAAAPGSLRDALIDQALRCRSALLEPVPLEELVEEVGVLAVRVLDANDPLAAAHDDPREALYAAAYQSYADSVRARVRLVYYGRDQLLVVGGEVAPAADAILARSTALYPFVGEEFYRDGSLRDWRVFDDRSVAFGVAAVSLARGMTDVANFAQWVWLSGGGLLPPPAPTPPGHVGPTITLPPLGGGLPERGRPNRGRPAMPGSNLTLPPP